MYKIVGDQGDIAVDDLDYEMNACSDSGTAAPVTPARPTTGRFDDEVHHGDDGDGDNAGVEEDYNG